MPAIDTIAAFNGTAGSTFGAGVFATGDSGSVRNFPASAEARLLAAFSDHVTAVAPWRVRSPLLHDNVRGIQFYPGTTPGRVLLPRYAPQRLFAQDTLAVELSTAASTGKALGALMIYYSELPGAAARLHMPGDVTGLIENIKPVVVTVASGANTAGQWLDVALTATENLLHANTDYAVLGFATDNPVACVAIKGVDTGNLRIGAPGIVDSEVTSDWFVRLSYWTERACIPVINSANAGATYVSLISSAATSAATNVQVILGELSQPVA